MCVFGSACVRASALVCVNVRKCVRKCVRVYVCVCECVRPWVFVFMHACVCVWGGGDSILNVLCVPVYSIHYMYTSSLINEQWYCEPIFLQVNKMLYKYSLHKIHVFAVPNNSIPMFLK